MSQEHPLSAISEEERKRYIDPKVQERDLKLVKGRLTSEQLKKRSEGRARAEEVIKENRDRIENLRVDELPSSFNTTDRSFLGPKE